VTINGWVWSTSEDVTTCNSITVLNSSVLTGATVTLTSGESITIGNDFSVAAGGELVAQISPSLRCDTTADVDQDLWNECEDCDDNASTCGGDCGDTDSDGRADCRDLCLDGDYDGYGNGTSAGDCTVDGSVACDDLGSACLGTDCNDSNSSVHPAGTEVCNGIDDDCDGLVDTDDPDLVFPLNPNQLGACAGTTQTCTGGGGWVEDYSAVPGYGLFEEPNAAFFDENCDGIDGTVSNAVFVAVTGNDDSPGTISQPKQTIEAGLTAASGGQHVYVAAGTYNAAATVAVKNAVSVYGGYSASDWGDRSASHVVNLVVADPKAVQAENVTSPTVLARLDITSANNAATAGSAYGVFASESDGLILRYLNLESGASGAGTDGTGYSGSAASGGNGSAGQPGCEDSDGLCASCAKPQGGAGGASSCGRPGGQGGDAERASAKGSPGSTPSGGGVGGQGVPSGLGDWSPTITYRGGNGSSGSPGSNGQAGLIVFSGSGYAPVDGLNGNLGNHGYGGGGGGGGGGGTTGCNSYGGGGGGGGAGGCRGRAGSGGGSAGGSFAVYLWNSNATITGCTLGTGDGGHGGAGGQGENGGGGGAGGHGTDPNAGNNYGGGTEQDDGSNGGRGGNGGAGGRGGHGGGGAGGPVIGVLIGGDSTPTLTSNTFNLGTAGNGGSSDGNSSGPSLSANTHPP
jgi:hypothetical protein